MAIDHAGDVVTSTHPTGGASAWRIVHVDDAGALRSISCPSVDLCVAVDDAGGVATSADPTGGPSTWSVTRVDGTNGLNSVSCPSRSLCVAVDSAGNALVSTDPVAGASAWSIAHIDNGVEYECYHYGETGAGCQPPLGSVSCAAKSSCVAVDDAGNVISTTNPTGGASAWTGGSSTASIPASEAYDDVSCPSTSLCFLVDSYGGDVVAWNPAASPPLQKITPLTPNTGVFTIACPNVSLCLASDDRGHVFTSTDPTGGISTWAAAKLESQGGLLIADCPTPSLCFVVDAAGNVFVGTRLTAPDVRAQLRAALTPTKQTARIESLLKGDGAVLNFTAPGAGRLRISWYAHRPRHSHVSHRGAPETLVATGGWSYARAGAGRVRIMLTHEGRQILEHSNRIKVTGRYRFMPTGGRSIDAAQTFTLKR